VGSAPSPSGPITLVPSRLVSSNAAPAREGSGARSEAEDMSRRRVVAVRVGAAGGGDGGGSNIGGVRASSDGGVGVIRR
jgi:hypothetical protein